MTPKSDNHRFFISAQNRGTGVRWTSFAIFNRFALAPFCNRFDINTEFSAQRRGCSLRSLYCCSDCVRGRGAAVTYLSPNDSFHSKEQIAPSNRGIKHLGNELFTDQKPADLWGPKLPRLHLYHTNLLFLWMVGLLRHSNLADVFKRSVQPF